MDNFQEQFLAEMAKIREAAVTASDPDVLTGAITKALDTRDKALVEAKPTPAATIALAEASDARREEAQGFEVDFDEFMSKPTTMPEVKELQRASDALYIGSRMLNAHGKQLADQTDARMRPCNMKAWREFKMAAHAVEQKLGLRFKALNTSDNSDWTPAGFTGQLKELIEAQRRVTSVIENVSIPRSPFDWFVEGTIGLPYMVGENTGDTGEKVPTRTPTTPKVQFDAKVLGVRVPISRNFDEDSVVAAEPYVMREVARSLVNGVETAVLNGDTAATHMDTVVTASNDCRKIFQGLRKLAKAPSTDTETDLSTFTDATLRGTVTKLGEYGVAVQDLIFLVSVKTYFKILADTTNFANYQSMDKLGAMAINVTGEVGAIGGIPLVVSAYLPETCNNASVDAGTGTDAICLVFNRRAYALATQGAAEMTTIYDAEALQYKVIGHTRIDFQPWFAAATNTAVSVGWNISVA